MTGREGNERVDSGPPSGKRAQFVDTALPFTKTLYNQALRLCREPHDASDLVQETFLRAYRTFENYQAGTNSKAWLFKIMYSIFVNKYRKEQREPAKVPFEEAFHRRANEWANAPETARIASRRSLDVEQALRDLPESFRSAVLMVDVDGLTYEEAAETLDCPVGTVRSRLSRGRKCLFITLQDYARKAGVK